MPRFTLEEKRVMKEYEAVIKGNEAMVLAIYQAQPFHGLGTPDDIRKLLTSLSADTTPLMVDDAFTLGIKAIELTLFNMAGQLRELKEQYARGDIAISNAENKLNIILKEIGKWKP